MSFLVLARREGEAVRIGADIRVIVTEIRGGQVRLAFEAPRWVTVTREDDPRYKELMANNIIRCPQCTEFLEPPRRVAAAGDLGNADQVIALLYSRCENCGYEHGRVVVRDFQEPTDG